MADTKSPTSATVDNVAGDTSNPAENKRRQAAIDNKPLCTVTLSDKMATPPEVINGKVMDDGEEVDLNYYLSNLEDDILVEQTMFIGRAFEKFSEYFATHVNWITELRCRLGSQSPRQQKF